MRSPLPMLLLVLAACSASKDGGYNDADREVSDTDSITPGTLRIDVFPPANLGSPPLLLQSHTVRARNYEGVPIALYPTATLSGRLTADVVRGWRSAVGVPATPTPLVATVSAFVAGTSMGGSVASDENGEYSLAIPAYPGGPYAVSVVPEDAEMAPVYYEIRDAADDDVLDVHLEVGIPIYGRVVATDGNGAANVPLRIVQSEPEGDVTSSVLRTDSSGWYVARVDQIGAYTLEVVGGPTGQTGGRIVPALSAQVLVEDAEAGVALDIDLGALGDVRVTGLVVDDAGEPVAGATVRLRSTRLDDSGGSLEVETETNDDGVFVKQALAGTYDIEVFPSYDDAGSPGTFTDVSIGAESDVGTLELAPSARLSGTVVDADGNRTADVRVTATQLGYGGFTYDGATDENGDFSVSLPDAEYAFTFTPASTDVPGALTRITGTPRPGGSFALEAGDLLDGTVSFDGKVVPWALLEVYDAATGNLVGRGTTDEDGAFGMLVHIEDTDTGR